MRTWSGTKPRQVQGVIELSPLKTSGSSGVVVTLPVLPMMQEEIGRLSLEHLTLITTDNGAPYKVKSLSNLFKDWFIEAGVPKCSVHSLRKAASTIAAENGATASDLQALFGWTTLSQASLDRKSVV